MAGQKHSWWDVLGRYTDTLCASHGSGIVWNYNVGAHLSLGSASKTSQAVVHISVCEVCFRWRIYNIRVQFGLHMRYPTKEKQDL